MAITEVFPNPTVERVIFQVRFPALFSMEGRIGDFQVRIMERFPESKLIYRRNIIVADLGPQAKLEALPEDLSAGSVKKIWNFKSPEGVELNVQDDSLDMTSTSHKTYNNPGGAPRFRDAIDFAMGQFLGTVGIPKLNRIGLRYIDNCPVPNKDNAAFRGYYNTAFNLERFALPDAERMRFEAIIQRTPYFFRYVEAFEDEKGALKLTLDFDGWALDIPTSRYLSVTDDLHDLIAGEYETSVKTPVYAHMRRKE